jgi:hypothetical protein
MRRKQAKTQLGSGSSSTGSPKSRQLNLPQVPENLWDEVAKVSEQVISSRPGPEWFTSGEYGAKFSLPSSTAISRLERLWSRGLVERRNTGRPRYYRVKR